MKPDSKGKGPIECADSEKEIVRWAYLAGRIAAERSILEDEKAPKQPDQAEAPAPSVPDPVVFPPVNPAVVFDSLRTHRKIRAGAMNRKDHPQGLKRELNAGGAAGADA